MTKKDRESITLVMHEEGFTRNEIELYKALFGFGKNRFEASVSEITDSATDINKRTVRWLMGKLVNKGAIEYFNTHPGKPNTVILKIYRHGKG